MSTDFERQCERERRLTLAILDLRYTRAPSARKEPRLEMNIADRLELRRADLVLTEFSPTWNGRQGAKP